jgi:hypothetical protein
LATNRWSGGDGSVTKSGKTRLAVDIEFKHRSVARKYLSWSMKNTSRIDEMVSYNSKTNNLGIHWLFNWMCFLLWDIWHSFIGIPTKLSVEEGLQRGFIISCVIGGVLACGILLILVFVWRKRSTRGKEKEGVKNGELSFKERETLNMVHDQVQIYYSFMFFPFASQPCIFFFF